MKYLICKAIVEVEFDDNYIYINGYKYHQRVIHNFIDWGIKDVFYQCNYLPNSLYFLVWLDFIETTDIIGSTFKFKPSKNFYILKVIWSDYELR